ncbi:MAG: hypothetical protein H0W15_09770 [Gemmatimonadales bacterium]|nr:hypothetical protein [Gemmatimonadales bacterium]
MSRNKRKPTAPSPAPTPGAAGRLLEIDFLAAIAMTLCVALAYATRNSINPDGVSYLDLASALRRGDWSAFVQGYWSPFYPVLLALAGSATSLEGDAFLPTVHYLNAAIAGLGIAAVWCWGHHARDRFIARAALATFIMAAARPLRIEAVTPDLLLLSLMAWTAYELIARRGERWVRLGFLLGGMFLAKTSVWPWLIVLTLVRLATADGRVARTVALRASGIMVLVLAPWVGAMSISAGQFTMSSAGRLNLCWYLESCDGRTPDTHVGDHQRYGQIALESGESVVVAGTDDQQRWTYLPWSDPTAWQPGVITQNSTPPAISALIPYWAKQAYYATAYWISPVVFLVLVPFALVHRQKRERHASSPSGRDNLIVAALGLAGVAQFIAVHAEPRLIAPFVLMTIMALLTWLRMRAAPDVSISPPARRWREGVTAATAAVALILGAGRLSGEMEASGQVEKRFAVIESRFRVIDTGIDRRVAVIGYAMPALGDLWRARARVVAQVPPYAAVQIGQLPADKQAEELRRMFGSIAHAAWLVNPDGRFQWVNLGE